MLSDNDIQFIQAFPFATLICGDEVSSVPVAWLAQSKCLHFHLSKQNPVSLALAKGHGIKVLINGPHAYISPYWYQSQPAVPTWNYANLLIKGLVELMASSTAQQDVLAAVAQMEPNLLHDSAMLPSQYVAKLNQYIDVYRLYPNALQHQHKLGGAKTSSRYSILAEKLTLSKRENEQQLAKWMNLL